MWEIFAQQNKHFEQITEIEGRCLAVLFKIPAK